MCDIDVSDYTESELIELIESDVKYYNDIDIYRQQVHCAELDYLDSLTSPDDIYNVDVFTGLLDYIYNRVFKYSRYSKERNDVNVYQNNQISIVDYSDTETLLELWNLYKSICTRYKKTYTQYQFCNMVGLTPLDEWRTQLVHSDDHSKKLQGKLRITHLELVKKILSDCEGATVNKALNSNSVGAMFVLKCCHGWQEQNTVEIVQKVEPHDTAEQIAARHETAFLPEKPDI